MTKKNLGSLVYDLNSKPAEQVTVIDQTRESLTEYEANVWECVTRGKKDFQSDFYVVVLTKLEKALIKTIRHYFLARSTCPTPNYDQTVYRYDHQANDLQLIWTIPSQDASHHILKNALIVAPEEKELRDFVVSFADGSLFTLCKKLNGEKEDSPLLEN